MSELKKEDQWEQGWDGHQEAQLLRWAKLSFHDKLLWLDEAQRQLDQLRQLNKNNPKPPNNP